jgi:hypothetical protein
MNAAERTSCGTGISANSAPPMIGKTISFEKEA